MGDDLREWKRQDVYALTQPDDDIDSYCIYRWYADGSHDFAFTELTAQIACKAHVAVLIVEGLNRMHDDVRVSEWARRDKAVRSAATSTPGAKPSLRRQKRSVLPMQATRSF